MINTHVTPRPIVALVGGIKAVPGRIMGHAGAFALPGEPDATEKVKALQSAGATIINHPSRFGPALKALLDGSAPRGTGVGPGAGQQRRGMHTHTRRPILMQDRILTGQTSQKRSIYLSQQTALDLLRVRGIRVNEESMGSTERLLAVSINRSTRNPCIIASLTSDAKDASIFDFEYTRGSADLPIGQIAAALGLDRDSTEALEHTSHLLRELVGLFIEKEAFLIETRVVETAADGVAVSRARLGLDDAALRSCGRQGDVHALRDLDREDPAEVGVEKDGIVYIKLPQEDGGNIGTLVNGAGLAMNTVDALADAGGRAANFLDTGGKATSETVKKSFEVILTDPRVKVCSTCFLILMITLWHPYMSWKPDLRLFANPYFEISLLRQELSPLVYICKHLWRTNTRGHDCTRSGHGLQGSTHDGAGSGPHPRHQREGRPEDHCRERPAAIRL